MTNDQDQVEALFTQDVEVDAQVWAVDGDLALVHRDVTTRNHGDPVAVQYDGVIVLRFDGDRCRELRGWFFRRQTR